MLDHVSLGANDIARAKAFYVPVLATVDLRVVDEAAGRFVDFGPDGPDSLEFSLETPADGAPATAANGVHVAFRASSRESVNAFHAAALAHGGRCAGPPGPRSQYATGYYAAFVFDLEGNKIEAVYHAEVRAG